MRRRLDREGHSGTAGARESGSTMGATSKDSPQSPQEQLELLDKVFGPEYFENGRLVVTVARDIAGVMKVAHKLQGKINESFGAMVEVITEHVKLEWWTKLHESSNMVGLRKGDEVPECQVTHIPEGVRVPPYKRDAMPTLEVLLLWDDKTRTTRGKTLYSLAHPQTPGLEQVGEIFKELEPYFAKRWVCVELCMAPPVKGEFEDIDREAAGEEAPVHDPHVGGGVAVTLLACHANGFARNTAETGAAHVRTCKPMVFEGTSDDSGRAKLCFLPAEVNKIQVAETERFHFAESMLTKAAIRPIEEGLTVVKVHLQPKALAAVCVRVFEMPSRLPPADATDGVIDWSEEERLALLDASVEVTALKDGEPALKLRHTGEGVFVADGGLPEGCVSLVTSCPGYEAEEQAVMLLVGANDFFVPLRKARG